MNVIVKVLGTKNQKEKTLYANTVYNLLEDAYSSCGGINLASGFKNADDMIKNIPVWRLTFNNNELISVMLFKVKSNKLKMVAYAPLTNIDPVIRKSDLQFMLNNSFAELSGKLLSITLKEIKSTWRAFVSKSPKQTLKKGIITLSTYLKTKALPKNSEGMYWKLKKDYPELLEYCYLRKIGNEFKLKILVESIN
ncbi:hypothetical protein [Formosa algae]|uniref:hypothetical protein n=1 Tax=Formosa algae TaxID=225843 RepID=UPI000CCDEB92|nr:hypothetical protein [Formosa algae]PNW26939.1 hypothetical protein BKP44_15175 [Formosa algae]